MSDSGGPEGGSRPGMTALHPAVASLGFLLGTWRGEGRGEYPTIESFAYGEEVIFGHVGKPFLTYHQRTWALDDQRPLHAEMGYLRGLPEGRLELVLAHPTGIAEVEEGRLDGTRLTLRTAGVLVSASAKRVDALERDFEVTGGTLRYEVRMAAVGEPLQHHLAATLERVPA